jgi:hypothetical protein
MHVKLAVWRRASRPLEGKVSVCLSLEGRSIGVFLHERVGCANSAGLSIVGGYGYQDSVAVVLLDVGIASRAWLKCEGVRRSLNCKVGCHLGRTFQKVQEANKQTQELHYRHYLPTFQSN